MKTTGISLMPLEDDRCDDRIETYRPIDCITGRMYRLTRPLDCITGRMYCRQTLRMRFLLGLSTFWVIMTLVTKDGCFR